MAAAKPTETVHTRGRARPWLEIARQSRQASAGLDDGRSEGRGAVCGATGMQLCYVLSQPQADDMVDVVAVRSKLHLVVLHDPVWRALRLRLGLRLQDVT